MARKKILNEFAADDLQSQVPDATADQNANFRPADNQQASDVPTQAYDIRMAFLNGIFNVVRGMTPDQLQKFYDDMMPYNNGGADRSVGGGRPASNPNQGSLNPGGGLAFPGDMNMPKLGESITHAELKTLLEETGLSEDFQKNAIIVFNTALNERLVLVEAKLQDEADKKLTETIDKLESKMQAVVGELSEGISDYMSLVVEQWFSENEVAIESGYKVQIGESILAGLKSLAEDHAISIKEENIDVVGDLQKQLTEMTERYNALANDLVDTKKKNTDFEKNRIVAEASNGLTLVQTNKLKQLVEDKEFVDEDSFKATVLNLKETYINQKPTKKAQYNQLNETNDGDDNSSAPPVDGRMALYVREASKIVQR